MELFVGTKHEKSHITLEFRLSYMFDLNFLTALFSVLVSPIQMSREDLDA